MLTYIVQLTVISIITSIATDSFLLPRMKRQYSFMLYGFHTLFLTIILTVLAFIDFQPSWIHLSIAVVSSLLLSVWLINSIAQSRGETVSNPLPEQQQKALQFRQ